MCTMRESKTDLVDSHTNTPIHVQPGGWRMGSRNVENEGATGEKRIMIIGKNLGNERTNEKRMT